MGYMWTRNLSFNFIQFLLKEFFSNISLCNKWVSFNIWLSYSIESFDHIDYWLKDLRNNIGEDIKLFFVGNKVDLEDSRVVSIDMGEKLREKLNFDKFMETSAKTKYKIKNLFVEDTKLL